MAIVRPQIHHFHLERRRTRREQRQGGSYHPGRLCNRERQTSHSHMGP